MGELEPEYSETALDRKLYQAIAKLDVDTKEKLLKINYLNYKDSMQSLIFKDVEKILKLINEREG